MNYGNLSIFIDVEEHYYGQQNVARVFWEVPFTIRFGNDFTCFHSNFTSYMGLKNWTVNFAGCLLTVAYKTLILTRLFPIVLFSWRMCPQRGLKIQQTQRKQMEDWKFPWIQWSFLNSRKVTVWCAQSVNGVIGPHCFDVSNVTREGYLCSLINYFHLMFSHLPAGTFFQHKRTSPRCDQAERNLLFEKISDSWIEQKDPENWPASSPDLAALHSFFCDVLNNDVVRTLCNISTQLESQKTSTLQNVTTGMLQKIRQNMQNRVSA